MSELPPDLSPQHEEQHQVAKGVAKAGGIMVASLLLSRVLGIARDSIISGMFGTSEFTDAYALAFQVPDLLFFLISGGALSSAFIPVFSEYWHTDRKQDAWKVFSSVLSIMSVIILAFIGISFVFAEPITAQLSPGKVSTQSFHEIVRMSRILLPAQYAFFIGGIMMGTLYTRKVFSIPGLGPNIYNIGIIFGAVVISHFVQPGVVGMCIGATTGAIVGNLIVPFLVIRKMGFEFKPTLSIEHEGTRKVFRLMLPVVLGLSLPGVFAMIMRYYGSYFPAGTNTVLDYGNKLMQAPLGIFGQSMAIAVFPALSQFYAEKKMDLFSAQLSKTLRTVVYLSIPASVLMAVLAPQICATLYQHGKFTAEATHQTAVVLQFFCIGIWAWCLHPILMRAFFSIQDTVTPIVIGTITTFVFITMVHFLKATSLGYLALPFAGSIAPIVMVIVMALVVSPRIGGIDIKAIGVTIGKCVLGSIGVVAVAGLIAWTPIASSIQNHKLPTILVTVIGGLASVWTYYLITRKLNMPETEYLDRAMAKINAKLGRQT